MATTAAARRTAELALKRLIVNGTDDPLLGRDHRADRSSDVLDRAHRRRRRGPPGARARAPTSRQSRKQIQSNDVSLKSLTDQQLPALDLTASYGLAGIGGPQFVRRQSALGGAVTADHPERLRRRARTHQGPTRADLELRG